MPVNPKHKAWSISRLQMFELCRKKWHHLVVLKDVVDDFNNEFAKYGKDAHTACELRVRDAVPLERRFKKFEGVCSKITAAPGELYTEMQLTLNESMERTGWFDADAYIRGIIDVMRINKTVAWLGDYKTGKMKDNPDQLILFALLVFVYFPKVTKVISSYIWLKDGFITKETYYRDEMPELWKELLPRAKQIEQALIENVFPAKTSGLCSYCPVRQQGRCDIGGR